jgi:hypothetical protein
MSDSNYASNPNAAEKGMPSMQPSGTPDNPELIREEPTIRGAQDTEDSKDTKSMRKMANPFTQYVAPEAPIWARYLDEAEVEDKELIDPWSGSLDSLLIFVSRLHPINLSS